MPYGTVNSKLWVNFNQQMHMVWHNFHFNYIGMNFSGNRLYQLL